MLLVLLCSFFSGCAQQKQQEAKNNLADAQEIIVGVDDYPPFNFKDENGRSTGIDVDLAREAFGRMGYKVRFERIEWGKKDDLLKDGKIDCLWTCFSMQGREQKYQWAGPYLLSKQVVAVTQDSDIKTLADLRDKVVAVRCATRPAEIFSNRTDKRIPPLTELYVLENRDLIYAMLGKGYVDAIAGHICSINQYNKDFTMNYRILEEPLIVTGIGVGFALDDKRNLARELDKTLREMRKDGTIGRITRKYVEEAESYLEVEKLAQQSL